MNHGCTNYVGGIVRRLGGTSLALNGTEDHLHLLAKLRPDKALSDVLRELKANATGWMHDVFPELKHCEAEGTSPQDFISRRIHSFLT